MRIASISLVKDEADIIEAFVRHNLHFVDRMYLVDDRSSDNTPEILRRLAAESDAVRVVQDGCTGAFQQSRRTTGLLHRIIPDDDWDAVLALDADEFVCAADRATFEADIAAIPPGAVGSFSEILYAADARDDASIADPLIRIRTVHHQDGRLPKTFAVRAVLGDPALTFSDGNHALRIADRDLPAHPLPNVALAHFPVRSADQIAIKCLKHYVGWRSRPDYAPALAGHLIVGAQSLASEPRFALTPASGVIGAYLGFDHSNGRERPFAERRGALKWPELAVVAPYVQVFGLLDPLIALARENEIKRARREALRARWSPRRLAAKLQRSFSKRFG